VTGERAAAVVLDSDGHSSGLVREYDVDARGRRVLAGVGQRLLYDAVGGEVHARRHRHRVPLHDEVDAQTRRTHVLHQPLDLLQPRLRAERQRVVAGAQHAEHSAHLPHRLARRRLDRGERLRLGMLLPQAAPDRLRLHSDNADAV
jgi:hypothetical protein